VGGGTRQGGVGGLQGRASSSASPRPGPAVPAQRLSAFSGAGSGGWGAELQEKRRWTVSQRRSSGTQEHRRPNPPRLEVVIRASAAGVSRLPSKSGIHGCPRPIVRCNVPTDAAAVGALGVLQLKSLYGAVGAKGAYPLEPVHPCPSRLPPDNEKGSEDGQEARLMLICHGACMTCMEARRGKQAKMAGAPAAQRRRVLKSWRNWKVTGASKATRKYSVVSRQTRRGLPPITA